MYFSIETVCVLKMFFLKKNHCSNTVEYIISNKSQSGSICKTIERFILETLKITQFLFGFFFVSGFAFFWIQNSFAVFTGTQRTNVTVNKSGKKNIVWIKPSIHNRSESHVNTYWIWCARCVHCLALTVVWFLKQLPFAIYLVRQWKHTAQTVCVVLVARCVWIRARVSNAGLNENV